MVNTTLLGATGSIGTSCLEVARHHGDRMNFHAVSAHRGWKKLAAICHEFHPTVAVISDEDVKPEVDASEFPESTRLLFGAEALEEVSTADTVDTVVAAIVGAAGLSSSYSAVKAGKRVAIANKETLVVAGPIIMQAAAESGSELIPVDSEHSAIFQALLAGSREDVAQVVLTSSGGPFREKSRSEIAAATPEQALNHPTWNMGSKITIDSATMMNKALEVIEARWLFNLQREQIDVVVHPQSIVHSFVEYRDGSVITQMSPPDMKLPIQYALSYPARWEAVAPRYDFKTAHTLEFHPPDLERFPALQLGFDVAALGGTSGAVLNAANEIAVSRFLSGELSFYDIELVCREMLSRHEFEKIPTLENLFALDEWTRKETTQWKP